MLRYFLWALFVFVLGFVVMATIIKADHLPPIEESAPYRYCEAVHNGWMPWSLRTDEQGVLEIFCGPPRERPTYDEANAFCLKHYGERLKHIAPSGLFWCAPMGAYT